MREKQNTLIETYLADIAKHSGKVNAMHISRIWQSIPAQLSRNQDESATKYKFSDVVPGIDRYSRLVGALPSLTPERRFLGMFFYERHLKKSKM